MWIMNMYMYLISFQMMKSKNHMLILMAIVFTCFLASMKVFLMSINHWMSILVVLVYVSGIMVLFMYIVSLTPNEKYKSKKSKTLPAPLIIMLLTSMSTPLASLENIKTNSSLMTNLTVFSLILSIIVLTAYIPPYMMTTPMKGMKTSK